MKTFKEYTTELNNETITESSVKGVIGFLMMGIVSSDFKKIIAKELLSKSKSELKEISKALMVNKSDPHIKYIIDVIVPLIKFDKELLKQQILKDVKTLKLKNRVIIESEDSVIIMIDEEIDENSILSKIKKFKSTKSNEFKVRVGKVFTDITVKFELYK